MAFTPEEREFLTSQRLGRVSTASSDAEPDVAVVGFSVDPDGEIVIGGLDNPRTIKWRNVLATGRAAFVVDDAGQHHAVASAGPEGRGSS
jgi:pyridoxamine 5'-phosphate oxidase family protein